MALSQLDLILIGSIIGGGIVLFFLIMAFIYMLFQKHCLSPQGNLCTSKLFMWTCIPCTICSQRCAKKGWWHKVDERVYLGAVPLKCLGHLRKLRDMGVVAVVNSMAEYKGPRAEYEALGIEQLYLPVIDHERPTYEQTVEAVEFIQRHHDAGGTIYLHCKGGHGRSGAIAFAWLLKNLKMSLEDTQKHINAARKVRKKLFSQPELVRFHRRFVLGVEDDGGENSGDSGGKGSGIGESQSKQGVAVAKAVPTAGKKKEKKSNTERSKSRGKAKVVPMNSLTAAQQEDHANAS